MGIEVGVLVACVAAGGRVPRVSPVSVADERALYEPVSHQLLGFGE
jgi:hypothetical protein